MYSVINHISFADGGARWKASSQKIKTNLQENNHNNNNVTVGANRVDTIDTEYIKMLWWR